MLWSVLVYCNREAGNDFAPNIRLSMPALCSIDLRLLFTAVEFTVRIVGMAIILVQVSQPALVACDSSDLCAVQNICAKVSLTRKSFFAPLFFYKKMLSSVPETLDP